MAWIESHQALKEHPKTLLLMNAMGWNIDETLGKLHRFWWWCVDYAEDGKLEKFMPEQLAMVVGVDINKAQEFVETMLRIEWFDKEPCFRVHDWWDYIGRFLQTKYKHHPEKWKKIKRLYVSGNNRSKGGSNTSSKNHKPNLTLPNLTLPNLKDIEWPIWLDKEAWDNYIQMRMAKKKPPTDNAVKLLLKRLGEWHEEGIDTKAVLEKSTVNNWTDVYKPEKKNNGHLTDKGTKSAEIAAEWLREKQEQGNG